MQKRLPPRKLPHPVRLGHSSVFFRWWRLSCHSTVRLLIYLPSHMELKRGRFAEADLVVVAAEGKLDVLRVECRKCTRKGRYQLHKVIAKYGRRGNLLARAAMPSLPPNRVVDVE